MNFQQFPTQVQKLNLSNFDYLDRKTTALLPSPHLRKIVCASGNSTQSNSTEDFKLFSNSLYLEWFGAQKTFIHRFTDKSKHDPKSPSFSTLRKGKLLIFLEIYLKLVKTNARTTFSVLDQNYCSSLLQLVVPNQLLDSSTSIPLYSTWVLIVVNPNLGE